MSSEQITQETVPVEKTETSTETTATPSDVAKSDTPVSPTTETQPAAKTWKEAISEEFRNDPNIEKFTEIDALAKSYINATQMIGKDKVAVPNKNSTDDQWNEVYDKLGRPESADKYSLNAKSEVVPIDEQAIKQFAENAHQLGLNNKQAQGILEFYKNNMEGMAKQAKVDTETAQAQSTQQLRQEWGREFDTNIKKAGALAKANMNPEILDMQLKDGMRLGDHPEIIKGFAKIAGMMSEDKIVSTESENVSSNTDVETEISDIMNNKDGPYWNRSHPDHDKVVQQVYTLREMITK
ncbi:putative capsid assembly protein [uncultured Mediterranean phage uvDeep-CGR2-KM24-C165]|jgi:hypothetical protein|nr:putative capsid assembly protein [uncultured Mediterranean phage uvDeep-CGR2-KM24-C165]